MRDLDRIKRLLDDVLCVWHKYPDMRLGQLLIFVGKINNSDTGAIFYREDEEWKELFEEHL